MPNKLLDDKNKHLDPKRPRLKDDGDVSFFAELKDVIVQQLNDDKAEDVVVLDLVDKSDIAYFMVVATGRSSRHASSLAEKIVDVVKPLYKHGIHVEGMQNAEWVLVDLHGVIVHVFQHDVRARYDLEKLWENYVRGDEGITS